jgi:hypothetical protein
MILTSPDTSSLLTRWEWAEYVGEGLVVIGCIGEVLADFGEDFLGRKHSKRLERLSSVILIVGLLLSLKALMRTNELSGSVIGGLGEKSQAAEQKADTAERKAQTALQDSSTASSRANDAKEVAGQAQKTAAGAKKEADSFEMGIASAKEQAAKAESSLAEANSRLAASLREVARHEQEIKDIRSPRSLIGLGNLNDVLSPFKGTEYALRVFQDSESGQFARALDEVLGTAGWIRKPLTRPGVPLLTVFGQDPKDAVEACVDTGIVVYLPEITPKSYQAANNLIAGLEKRISPPNSSNVGTTILFDKVPSEGPIRICVGKKP